MISSKIIPQEKKNLPKTLKPGNHKCKIFSIELTSGYNPDSYRVYLNLEGENPGEDFEGFLLDKEDESKGRHQGQVARVRLDQFDFETKTVTTRNGESMDFDKDVEIVKKLRALAVCLGVEEAFDGVNTDTMEQFIDAVRPLFCNGKFIHFCLAGKEYEKGGYTNYDLFLPKPKNNQFAFSNDPGHVIPFDSGTHIQKKKGAASVDEFAPTPADNQEPFSF